MNQATIVQAVKNWLETVVVGLNLCPFAKRELVKDRIRFVVSTATTEAGLLADLHEELERLNADAGIETTLLIHPRVLQKFGAYVEFLAEADGLIEHFDLDGVYQIASFHPEYQFAGTRAGDVENMTNRSPYPLLHLLREHSLDKAIADYPDVERIPERNIARMEQMGTVTMQALLQACIVK
ncbi:DUF1415 domain-containing protein [Marinobacter sp. X15-166B]|uniref:DUF1415 domain-containing protein n=1 Tax=Marinobacter sp. X15-166B TaxID=1897620 RepID=UPI00085C4164|nr:DUF1415 domain-containing protein [Marinobacter sp. X15-166B]OEY65331.1 hypothetical protein BG841_01875 [Marinobacter sp. X15-166B]